ncbi:hypothetical protein Dimus_023718 [Dionaea muscipula]
MAAGKVVLWRDSFERLPGGFEKGRCGVDLRGDGCVGGGGRSWTGDWQKKRDPEYGAARKRGIGGCLDGRGSLDVRAGELQNRVGEVHRVEVRGLYPPEKRRKFSPILREFANTSKNYGVVDTEISTTIRSCLPHKTGKIHHADDVFLDDECSMLTQETYTNNEQEPGQLEEEDFSRAPNISTSRWVYDDDLLGDSYHHAGDKDVLRRKEEGKKSSPGSGLTQRGGSVEGRARSSESDVGCLSMTHSGGKYCRNEVNDEHCMEIDGREEGVDCSTGQSDLQSDDDALNCGVSRRMDRNMLQECRNVFEYEKLGKISEGSYGVVYKARDKKTGEIVALKKMKLSVEREGFPLYFLREINTLLSFNHSSIVNVKEVVVDDSDAGFSNVFMAMEYMDHDLKALMEARKQPFSQSEAKCLMLQLLDGVKYLHDHWVLHRDLKTSNLLLNNKSELKICDFGMSRQYGIQMKQYTSLVVTLWYRAPELLLGAEQYSTAVDMWSVGCIMAELLASKPLFDGKTEFDQLDKIFRMLGTPNEKIWPGYSQLPGLKVNFVQQPYNMLHKKFPRTSFTGSPVLSDTGLDLLSKLLAYDPEKRISAKDALNHSWFQEVPLPKSKDSMPTFPSRYAQKRRWQKTMKSLGAFGESRRNNVNKGYSSAGARIRYFMMSGLWLTDHASALLHEAEQSTQISGDKLPALTCKLPIPLRKFQIFSCRSFDVLSIHLVCKLTSLSCVLWVVYKAEAGGLGNRLELNGAHGEMPLAIVELNKINTLHQNLREESSILGDLPTILGGWGVDVLVMAGKRGRPRKLQVVHRDSIASLRGKLVQGEQTLIDSGCVPQGLGVRDKVVVGGVAEGSDVVGRWGDDSVDQDAGEVETASVQHSQAPICADSKEEKEGVYLTAVRKGLMDSEGPRHEGPRSMIGNRDRHNGLPLSYEEHVGEELKITAEDIASELAFW